jgi:hypothetical protein
MRRFAQLLLVLSTAFAAFVASSLQGRVLCYADGGGHVALEAPHNDTGCTDAHEGHFEGGLGESKPEHDPHHNGCTDLSAEFSVGREASRVYVDAHHAQLTTAFTIPLPFPATSGDHDVCPSDIDSHPPAPTDLGRLGTIILLA